VDLYSADVIEFPSARMKILDILDKFPKMVLPLLKADVLEHSEAETALL
jgi:hypothetical protein